MSVKAFFDTNILLYTLSGDTVKADKAEELISLGGVISVQVLNEFASVALRKLHMPINEIRQITQVVIDVCELVPIDLKTHRLGLDLVQIYRLSLYDSMIAAAALLSDSQILYTEDLQHKQVLDGHLTVINPFKD